MAGVAVSEQRFSSAGSLNSVFHRPRTLFQNRSAGILANALLAATNYMYSAAGHG